MKKGKTHTYHLKKRRFLWCGREVKRLSSNIGLILRLCHTKKCVTYGHPVDQYILHFAVKRGTFSNYHFSEIFLKERNNVL